MKPACRIATSILLLFGCAAYAWAGSLDSRLAALAGGGHGFVRAAADGAVSGPRPANPMLPRVRADGRVQVYVHGAGGGAPLPASATLRSVGATGLLEAPALGVVQAWVPVGRLQALAALPGVGRVTVPAYGVAQHPHPLGPVSPAQPRKAAPAVPTGLAIDAAAVQAMQADRLQLVGATGASVKVGVISDGADSVADSQAAGYLPASVWIDPGLPGSGDEGTAMMEEVHAMAPGASLGFCGPQTTVDFLTCYDDFATWGAKVIVDDLGYFTVDYFTTGSTNDQSFAYGAASFAAAHPDIAITSSAGNDAQDYFEAAYVPGPGATIGGTAYPSLMDFGAALGGTSTELLPVQIYGGASIQPILEWNAPVNSTSDVLIPYLVDANGNVLASGSVFQAADGRLGAGFSYTAPGNETDYLAIGCMGCADPISIKLDGWGDGAADFGSFRTQGSVQGGQKVAQGILATAAVGVVGESPLSVNREDYSGTGPFLYGDVGATGYLAKPDLTGVDAVLVSGAGGFGVPVQSGGAIFCGTSATSPNIGALIAAMMQAVPGKSSSYYYDALAATAEQSVFASSATSGPCTPSNSGYDLDFDGAGLAQGFAALQSVFTFPETSITAPVSVPSGQTGTATVPTGVAVTYSASVQAGSNSAAAANCEWLNAADGSPIVTGGTVTITANTAGTYGLVANCPDDQGILSPTPPALTLTAEDIAAPTVTVDNFSKTDISVTLTGYAPLTVTASSDNTAVVPDSGISIPAGCGTTTLSCDIGITAASNADGVALVTVKAVDQWGRSDSQGASIRYTGGGSGSGGGGGLGGLALGVLALLVLVAGGLQGFAARKRSRR